MIGFILFVILASLCTTYWLLTKNYNYWRDRGIPFIKPVIFYGSFKNEFLKKRVWIDFPLKCYKQFKHHQYGGVFLFTTPALYICDIKMIERILVEDFSSFKDRWVKSTNFLCSSDSLTFGKGDKCHERRLKLAPAFAPTKVRGMFQQMLLASDHSLEKIKAHHLREEPMEAENLATSYSIDVIASCLFGVNIVDSYESILLRKALSEIYVVSKSRQMIVILAMQYPKIAKYLNIIKGYRDTMSAYGELIEEIINFRLTNHIRRNDILQVMLDLHQEENHMTSLNKKQKDKKNKQEGNLFTRETIAEMLHNFIFGGIKPTAQTITFALFEIARNPEVQKFALAEIETSITKHKGWNVDALEHMTYLDQIIQESLRLHSFNKTIFRVLTKPYNLPGTDVVLEEGMHVFVPIDAVHRDPEFYSEPEEFKPERFEGHNYKPTATWLPFGQGPRICVAIRLAVTMVKLCLARILAQYEVKISDRMQLPLELSDSDFYPRAKGGMWLDFVKRETSI